MKPGFKPPKLCNKLWSLLSFFFFRFLCVAQTVQCSSPKAPSLKALVQFKWHLVFELTQTRKTINIEKKSNPLDYPEKISNLPEPTRFREKNAKARFPAVISVSITAEDTGPLFCCATNCGRHCPFFLFLVRRPDRSMFFAESPFRPRPAKKVVKSRTRGEVCRGELCCVVAVCSTIVRKSVFTATSSLEGVCSGNSGPVSSTAMETEMTA